MLINNKENKMLKKNKMLGKFEMHEMDKMRDAGGVEIKMGCA